MSKLTKQQKAELAKLAKISDSEIDTSDIPEIMDWDGVVVGKFYRPIKKQVTLRLDVDMLTWFKSLGGKYQARINQALRDYMNSHRSS